MDQRRDRGRASHGVRKPDVERDLGRFAGHAQQHEHGDGEDHSRLRGVDLLDLGEDLIELQAAESPEHEEHGDQEAGVADPVHDHGLLAGDGVADTVLALVVPEADQQVGAQPDSLPAHEQHQEVVGRYQDHHGGDEQVEVDEEAWVAGRVALVAHVLVHIADSVDMDQRPHAGHHQHHRHRQGIHPESPRHAQLTDRDPVGEGHLTPFRVPDQGEQEQYRDGEGKPGGQAGPPTHRPLAHTPAEGDIDQQPQDREEDHQGHQPEERR
jgi:hypothetical protein